MDFNNLKINAKATLGSKQILKSTRLKYAYVGHERTNEIVGRVYSLVLPENAYEAIEVSVIGTEQLDTDNITGNPMVIVDGATIEITGFGDKRFVRCEAKGIRLADAKREHAENN